MTLTQIRYFLELCRTMNFTKAAENLYVAQPTLSRQIQLLETELDVTLLKRSRREVILTQAGEIFRNEFSKIDDEIEFAVMRVKKASESCQELRVGFTEAVLPIYVLNLVEQLIHCNDSFTVFCNPSERGLITLPLPEQAEKFRMVACWNQQAAPHLTAFFREIKTDVRSESSGL